MRDAPPEDHHLEFAKWLADEGVIGEGKGMHLSYVGECTRCGRGLNVLTAVELYVPLVAASGCLYYSLDPFCHACARRAGDEADRGSP